MMVDKLPHGGDYPIHGIVYKSALIGHWHATHPVVSIGYLVV